MLVTAALANAALTATEVALTAYVRHHQALWAAGPLLAWLNSIMDGGAAAGPRLLVRCLAVPRPGLLLALAFVLALGAAASAIVGARTMPGHAPVPFGKK